MNRKFFNLTALVVMLITMMGLAGCDDQPAPSTQEIASPTGCFKSKGRYFDPKTQQCVQVTDKHQALVLNAYRYVNKLVEDGKVTDADYYIFLKTYVTIEKAEALWSELQKQGATMVMIAGNLPADREYDSVSGSVDDLTKYPKIWGEGSFAQGCSWLKRDDAPADTVQGMLLEGVKSLEAQRPRPQMYKAILEDHDCRVYSMFVHAKPEVIRDFWNNHLEDVEGIQPYITVLDQVQPSLGPVQPLKEGN